MTNKQLELSAEHYGSESTVIQADTVFYPTPVRLRRAAWVFFPLLLAAILVLPIPVLHLVAVPAFLVFAVVLGLRRLREEWAWIRVRGPCPACRQPQEFDTPSVPVMPITVACPGCGEFVKIQGRD